MCACLGVGAVVHADRGGVGHEVDASGGDVVLLLQDALDCSAAAAAVHALHVEHKLVHGRACGRACGRVLYPLVCYWLRTWRLVNAWACLGGSGSTRWAQVAQGGEPWEPRGMQCGGQDTLLWHGESTYRHGRLPHRPPPAAAGNHYQDGIYLQCGIATCSGISACCSVCQSRLVCDTRTNE